MRNKSLAAAVIPLLFLACGDAADHADHAHADADETPEAEACEHLTEGPFEAITAVENPLAPGPPNAAVEHTRVDISFVDITGSTPNTEGGDFGGTVAFEATEATEYLFFLSAAVPLSVFDATAGVFIPLENEVVGSELCSELATTHTYVLEVGTYLLTFGPTDLTEVGMVHEEAGGHASVLRKLALWRNPSIGAAGAARLVAAIKAGACPNLETFGLDDYHTGADALAPIAHLLLTYDEGGDGYIRTGDIDAAVAALRSGRCMVFASARPTRCRER